jgi:glucoamylase
MASDPATLIGGAFGHPGIPPTWSISTKDGIGTAYAVSSRVWFTLAKGILTEIYFPTIDRPQIRDGQFLITDGATFFHEERRDLDGKVERIAEDSLGYRVTSVDPNGRYTLIKEVISDPHSACVLVRGKFIAAPEWKDKLRVYFLLAPHLEVGGWNNSAMKLPVAGRNVLLAWKDRVYMAIDTDRGFRRSSCGFVGASDGWQDLHDNFKMDWEFDRAENGNVAVMGEVDLSHTDEFVIAIAFGDSMHAATAVLSQALAQSFDSHKKKFVDQWQRIGATLHTMDHVGTDGGALYRTSRTLLLSHEDKTFAGALIASASIPWGEAMGDDDLGGYHLVWVRDMVNSATGLLASGDVHTPLRALVYLACSQQPDGGFPQNFWIDGTPYWKGIQLDEVAFPIILAWRLWKANGLEQFDPYPTVRAAAKYIVHYGPITQQERWEECSGYSPSTLAVAIAALICAADFANAHGENQIAHFLEEYADFMESHLERWCVTTEGTLVPGIKRHYIRLLPVDVNDHSPAEDPNNGTIILANRPPGTPYSFKAKEIVDAGFLELVRYGVRQAGTPLMEDSLRVVDALLKRDTPSGPAWRRYNYDGYGPSADGKPYQGHGIGRAWPLLAGERAHYELAAGRNVQSFITSMEKFATQGGMLPEQVWDEDDIPAAYMYRGRSAGSATPLMWAHAEYIKLLRSVSTGQVFDLIPVVANRYLPGLGRKDLEVWKLTRRVRKMKAGDTLRVMWKGRFRVRWAFGDEGSLNEARQNEASSADSGLDIGYVDIATPAAAHSTLRLTFLQSDTTVLDETIYEVELTA